MSLRRRAFVLGGHITPFIGKHHPDFIWKRHPDFGTRENPTLEDYILKAVTGALESTGTPASAIEKGWIGNFCGELFSNQGHLGPAVAGAHPDLLFKPFMRVEGACASGGLAFVSALESIQAGTDVTLVVGAEVQTTVSAREGGDFLARASHYRRQRPIDDFTFPAMFANRNMHYQQATDLTAADLAKVSAKAYANANKNPLAHMRAVTMTETDILEGKNPQFLSNEALKPYLHMSDCSQVSDGGAAMIVVSEEGLAKLGKTPADAIEVLSIGHATGNLFVDADPLRLLTTEAAVSKAYEGAGLKAEDVQIAEVHDCFTITEVLMYEAIGLAAHGKGAHLIREGHTNLEGKIPVNTGGGLVGYGHPVGATGIKQVLEIFRQMKGQCGDYQVSSTPEVGLCANMGGDDKTAVVTVLANR
ncbi:MAG: thiolase C-terminal domain-containing protein [Bradymonadia bacterium]